MHDETLDRVAGENVKIENLSLNELEKVILYNKDGTKSNLHIPTIENYIEICKQTSKYCVIDLKIEFSSTDIKNLIKIIKNQNYLNKTIFISFYFNNLVNIRKILPAQPVQLIFKKVNKKIIKQLKENKFDADVKYKNLSKRKVKKLHQENIKVNCWTVNKKKTAEKLVKMGVDFITTKILE
jgi:glycerophosphoryl diester phosphodiesterase